MAKFYCKVCNEELEGKRRKFCSQKCITEFHSPNKLGTNTSLECIQCGNKYEKERGDLRSYHYCSPFCSSHAIQNANKNPLSTYGTDFRRKRKAKAKKRQNGLGDPTWLCGSFIGNMPDNIRYTLACIPDGPYVVEDMEEIERIIWEERNSPRVVKSKKQKLREIKAKARAGINWQRGTHLPYKLYDKKLKKA